MENENQEKIIWAEYNRRSSDEDSGKQIISIDRQKEELETRFPRSKYKRDYHLWESRSAYKKDNRPEFKKLVDLIEKGKVTGIICWAPDRLSRNPFEAGMVVDLLTRGKIKDFKFGSYSFDNSAEGIMLLQFALSQSQYFSAKLSRDVKSGNRKHLERGQWIAVAKPGYINREDPITKERYVDKDPERYEQINNIFHSLLNGERPMDILRKLNRSGYTTRKTKKLGGRLLSKASFYRIITDPFYYGDMVRREGIFLGKHPTMITRTEFDLIQIKLGNKGRPRYSKTDFPYKDVLKCGECGGSVTCEEKWQIVCTGCKTKFHKGKNTNECPECQTKIEEMKNPKLLHYIFYHCTKRVHKDCTQGSISLDKLETKIDNELQQFEIDEDFRDWAIAHLNEINTDDEQRGLDTRASLDKRLRDVEWSINNLIRLRIRKENIEAYEDEEKQLAYDEEENRLLAEKKTLKKQIDELDTNQVERIDATKEVFDFAYHARNSFDNGNTLTKTKILSRLGSNLVIKDRELHIDGENAFFLIAKGKEEIKNIIDSLEPEKIPDNSKALLCLDSVCQSWRKRRDSNSRAFYSADFPGLWNKPLSDSSLRYDIISHPILSYKV